MKFLIALLLFCFYCLSFARAESTFRAQVFNRLIQSQPRLNYNDLVRIHWSPSHVKVALRDDWLENFLTLELTKILRNHPDIRRGEGTVRIAYQNPTDSLLYLQVWFHVVPKKLFFDADVRCNALIRVKMTPAVLRDAKIEVLDRKPIRDCVVSGSIGETLDLGDYVANKLNDKISELPQDKLLFKIGETIFQDSDMIDKMGRMYLLKELEPYALMTFDDCDADAGLGIAANTHACLALSWPEDKFKTALTNILNKLPTAEPANLTISQDRVEDWRRIGPLCENKGIPYPSKMNCDTGDMTLFSGLLCLSGEELGCKMVADSLDSRGQWWRSPQLIGATTQTNDFSGDMFGGAIAYLAKTKDQSSFNRWLGFILGNSVRIPDQGSPQLTLYKSCYKDTNGTCQLMGDEWHWLRQLAQEFSTSTGNFPNYEYDPSWLLIQSLTNERGYRLHLVAVSTLLHKYTGHFDKNMELVAKVLAAREPENPFFVYLAFGKDKKVYDLVDKYCPAFGAPAPKSQHQWSWEREIEDKAYESTMGWDCVFMANLLNNEVAL